MRPILRLDNGTSHSIRSHVVIDSLRAVIRELLRNSIEAGSTDIVLKIDLNSLSVCCEDNGEGILEEDLQFLSRRHHTSKHCGELSDGDKSGTQDILPRHKGEALSSIIECSSNALILSAVTGKGAREIAFSGSTQLGEGTIHSLLTDFFKVERKNGQGTTVLITRLFSKTPVRYERIRDSENADSLKRDLKVLLFELLHDVPHIRLDLMFREGAQFHRAFGLDGRVHSKELMHNLFDIPLKSLHTVHGTLNGISMEGFVSHTGSHMAGLQFLFSSGRRMLFSSRQTSELRVLFRDFGICTGGRLGVFNKSVTTHPVFSFHTMEDDMPNNVEKDVEKLRFDLVKRLLVCSFREHGLTNGRSSVGYANLPTPSPEKHRNVSVESFKSPRKTISPKKSFGDQNLLPTTPTRGNSRFAAPGMATLSMSDLEDGNFVLLGQILDLVILLTVRGALFAIDQHACDERIRLESMLEEFTANVLNVHCDLAVRCPTPVCFGVSGEEVTGFQTYSGNFLQFGIRYHFEANRVIATHLPSVLSNMIDSHILKECLLQHVADLRDRRKSIHFKKTGSWFLLVKDIPAVILEAYNSLACKLSIKFGSSLSKQEMEILVVSLARCHLPLQCAHGRPTIVQPEDFLEGERVIFAADEEL